jgi:hypothetical protein
VGVLVERLGLWVQRVAADVQWGTVAEPSITCPRCGRTSYNPNDIREGYCGYCHDWTSVTPEKRQNVLGPGDVAMRHDRGES